MRLEPILPAWRPGCILLLIALLLLGCASSAGGRSVDVHPLDRPALPMRIGVLDLEAALQIEGGTPAIGGLSALLVDGTALTALSDRGTLWQARLVEDSRGRLRGAIGWRALPLHQPAGGGRLDTEGLARLPDGALAVSQENEVPLLRLDPGDRRGMMQPLPFPPVLLKAPSNQKVEALADLPEGGLLMITEGLRGKERGTYVALVQRGGERIPLLYRPAEGFVATGADRVDQDLFIVERRVSILGGFESRVVLVDLGRTRLTAGAVVDGLELARLGTADVSENFEGIAARRAVDGSVLLYLVSDDNFSVLQRTLLLQLRWQG
jgi:hypothetical protein